MIQQTSQVTGDGSNRDHVLLGNTFSIIRPYLTIEDVRALGMTAKRYFEKYFDVVVFREINSRNIQELGGYVFPLWVRGLDVRLGEGAELRVYKPQNPEDEGSRSSRDIAISSMNADRIRKLSLHNVEQLEQVKKALGLERYGKIEKIEFLEGGQGFDINSIDNDGYFDGKKVVLKGKHNQKVVIDLVKKSQGVRFYYKSNWGRLAPTFLRGLVAKDETNGKKFKGVTIGVDGKINPYKGRDLFDREKDKACFKHVERVHLNWKVSTECEVGNLPELNDGCKLNIRMPEARRQMSFDKLMLFLGEKNLRKVNRLRVEFDAEWFDDHIELDLNAYAGLFENVKALVLHVVAKDSIKFPELTRCEHITLICNRRGNLSYMTQSLKKSDWHKVKKVVLNDNLSVESDFDFYGSCYRGLLQNLKELTLQNFALDVKAKPLFFGSLPKSIKVQAINDYGEKGPVSFATIKDFQNIGEPFNKIKKEIHIVKLNSEDLTQESVKVLADVERLTLGRIEIDNILENKDKKALLQQLLSGKRLKWIRLETIQANRGVDALSNLKEAFGSAYSKLKVIRELRCEHYLAFSTCVLKSGFDDPLYKDLEEIDIYNLSATNKVSLYRNAEGNWTELKEEE